MLKLKKINMRINPKKNFKPYIIVATLVLLSLAAVGVYAFSRDPETARSGDEGVKPINTQNLETPTNVQVDTGNDAKKNAIEKDEQQSQVEPGDPLSIAVSASLADGTLYIRSNIDALLSTGTCELTLSQGSRTVRKTASVQALAQSTTCQGFNVSASELSEGEWSVSVSVESGDRAGIGTTKVSV